MSSIQAERGEEGKGGREDESKEEEDRFMECEETHKVKGENQ